ncbi:sodium:calcium antiporter [Barrientosiimonas marina]|uniref:Sodium:calcium antiporter n=1 Tax=Lentibacillus kimchii TaxID=1542911 RepID=A0ABW2UYF1_9BACI
MVFVWFGLAAAITVLTAIKLSQYADVISSKTRMGGMLVGTVLLAGATSLPELTTSFSAVVIANSDIAIGNMLGSNLFNIFILAVLDLFYRRHKLFYLANRNHKYTAFLGLFLMLLVLTALLFRPGYTLLGGGVDAWLILAAYIAGMIIISQMPSPQTRTETVKDAKDTAAKTASIPVKFAIIGFILTAVIILGSGTLLSITGDEIADVTGLGSSFIGSFLVAAATSLPEAVSVFSALRLKNVNLAIGAILGSNMLNMVILALSDFVYQDGAILTDVSASHIVSAAGGSFLAAIIIWSFMRQQTKSLTAYSNPSVIMVVGYFLVQYLVLKG